MNLPFLRSAPGDAVVIVEGLYNGSVERLYRAWTVAEELKQWFGPSKGLLLAVETDLCVGGRICFDFVTEKNIRSAIEGNYLEIVPNEKLVFTWSHVVVEPDGKEVTTPNSKVTVTFESQGPQTRVRLCHEGIDANASRNNVCHGWNGSMTQLQEWIEGK